MESRPNPISTPVLNPAPIPDRVPMSVAANHDDSTDGSEADLEDSEFIEMLTKLGNIDPSWRKDSPLCRWKGITLDEEDRIVRIEVKGLGLTGSIDLKLFPRTMRVINLGHNALSGTINLLDLPPKLNSLKLQGNSLACKIPFLSLPRSLVYINLNDLSLRFPSIQREALFVLAEGEEKLHMLSDQAAVIRTIDGVRIRYEVPANQPAKAARLYEYHLLGSRCLNSLMSYSISKHRDNSVTIDMEYADASTLRYISQRLPEQYRSEVAMSVAVQVCSSLAYFKAVHRTDHGCIRPRYIYTRRDGCIKTDVGQLFTIDDMRRNWMTHYEFCPYNSPEMYIVEPGNRMANSARDTWALGVLILSCATARTYDYPLKPEREGDLHIEPVLADLEAYEGDCELFNSLIGSNDPDEWREAVESPVLRFLIKMCLNRRPSFTILLAWMFFFGANGASDVWKIEDRMERREGSRGEPDWLPGVLEMTTNSSQPIDPNDQEDFEPTREMIDHVNLIAAELDRELGELATSADRRTAEKAFRELTRSRQIGAWAIMKQAITEIRGR